MPAALPIAGLALGGLGLFQQSQQAKAQSEAMRKATKPAEIQALAMKDLLAQGERYNPHEEDKLAIQSSNQNALQLLQQQLGALNGGFIGSGGSPTGDTAFNVNATNTANRVLDPLKMFQAQLASTETSRKMAALSPVLGAPSGQMANSYFQQAQMLQPNYGPSLGMFSNALGKLFPQQAAGIGAVSGLDPSSFGSSGLGQLISGGL